MYLYQNGRVTGEGRVPVTLEQGYEIDRGGRVWAELEVKMVKYAIFGLAVTP